MNAWKIGEAAKGGTSVYQSPQRLAWPPDRQWSTTLTEDMWGLGITFYLMLTGTFPFALPANCDESEEAKFRESVKEHAQQFQQVIETNVQHLDISKDCKDLLKSLLRADPARRITAEAALESRCVRHFHCTRSTNMPPLSKTTPFRQLVLSVMNRIAPDEQRNAPKPEWLIRSAFELLDQNDDGYITEDDLDGYSELLDDVEGHRVSYIEFSALFSE
eukprot:GEMP01019565.1.p1 GENE.GEMP01019565.1~~GEMP01019565.1.p1  ORF type:complete len:218 (+),score=37.63 GEMP01019565.1:641-1294(+)